MRKRSFLSLSENVISFVLGSAFSLAGCWLLRVDAMPVVDAMTLLAYAYVAILAIDDAVFKVQLYKDLANWQEYAGVGLVLATDLAFLWAWACSSQTTMYVALGLTLAGTIASLAWFYVPYRISVMGSDELEQMGRDKCAAAVKAKDEKGMRHGFGKYMHFHLVEDNYTLGPDYNQPFDDSGRFMSLREMRATVLLLLFVSFVPAVKARRKELLATADSAESYQTTIIRKILEAN